MVRQLLPGRIALHRPKKTSWYLKACPVCGGDCHDDVEDIGSITCFMCARTFPLAEVQPQLPEEPDPEQEKLLEEVFTPV